MNSLASTTSERGFHLVFGGTMKMSTERFTRKILIVQMMGMLSALFTMVASVYGAAFSWMANQHCLLTNVIGLQERKQNYFLLKLKQKRLKRLQRKKRAYWFKPGRTDLWWQNLLNGTALKEAWRKISDCPGMSSTTSWINSGHTFHPIHCPQILVL